MSGPKSGLHQAVVFRELSRAEQQTANKVADKLEPTYLCVVAQRCAVAGTPFVRTQRSACSSESVLIWPDAVVSAP